MLLLFLAYLGGILTILSPCILPVLPFVFARSDQPFRKSGLPLLAGMAITFAPVASLATVGGGWAIRANQFGRGAALLLFGIFGLTLIFPSLAERLSRPLVRLGNRLSEDSSAGPSARYSFLLGIGTGLLCAPCAGPILGLILTGAALGGASIHTTVLLLAYAAGAATSLMAALLAGGRIFATMKHSLGAEEWTRRALSVAVLAGLLKEANHKPLPGNATQIAASGAEAAADSSDVRSPETYIGYHRAENFASPGGFNQNEAEVYQAPANLRLNEWAFSGKWEDERQIATSLLPSSTIIYRFHARDLHLVLGPSKAGRPIRFRVTIDGKAPGADHRMDTDAGGYGTVNEDRLYQLIRQHGAVQDRTLRIEFLVPGVQAYSFTFG
jgi:cytochrome c biogenesis protein CcdA